MFENFILYNVIKEINLCLLNHIHSYYKFEMIADHRLLGVGDDIFSNILKFLEELQEESEL